MQAFSWFLAILGVILWTHFDSKSTDVLTYLKPSVLAWYLTAAGAVLAYVLHRRDVRLHIERTFFALKHLLQRDPSLAELQLFFPSLPYSRLRHQLFLLQAPWQNGRRRLYHLLFSALELVLALAVAVGAIYFVRLDSEWRALVFLVVFVIASLGLELIAARSLEWGRFAIRFNHRSANQPPPPPNPPSTPPHDRER